MIEQQFILGGLAVVVGIVSYAFYVRGIWEGKVKPHAFTWFIWTILMATAFWAQVSEGGGPGAWVTGFTALASLGFTLVGLGSSSRVLIVKSDLLFFVAALVAIPLWYLTGSPFWSVIAITIIDAAAFVPTFRKAYVHPETENIWTYALAGVKFIFGIMALQSFSVVTVLYPASLVLANGVFVLVLAIRRTKSVSVEKP